jgi:hypothetical protein
MRWDRVVALSLLQKRKRGAKEIAPLLRFLQELL